MGNINIAIATTDTLLFLGIRALLQDLTSTAVRHIADIGELITDNPDSYDIIIADAEMCIANLDYFIPRRNKTILVATKSSEQSSFPQINRHADSGTIIEQLSEYIYRMRDVGTSQSDLTQREIDVLKLVASGKINKEIADELQISINTVLTHRKNITAKLGIRSVSGLSVYAMMNGYLTNL